jgi:hypothetical protein
MGLDEEVKKELGRSTSINEIKTNLIHRGYIEEDVEQALNKLVKIKSEESTRNDKILSTKEFLDRIGYGFANQQFINILFMLSGAPLFMIGFLNAIKNSATSFLAGFMHEYSRSKNISKGFISSSGIIYGLSFLGMTIAIIAKNPWIFAFSILLGTLGIMAHGDPYTTFANSLLRSEKRRNFLKFISYFGILITAGSMMIAGWLMELIPISGEIMRLNMSSFNLAEPMAFKLYGHLLIFEITAIMFILSGYFLSFVQDKKEIAYGTHLRISAIIQKYWIESLKATKIFTKNPKIFLLMIASILITVIQVVGGSYYGIFIYQGFKHDFLGGFLNVALIFVIALVASITGTIFTKNFSKSLGEAPMLVFGTLLIALLPVTFYFNPNLYSIALATALSVVGGAIVGVAQGLIAERLMNEEESRTYFSSIGFASILPILLFGFLGALIAQATSLKFLFLILGIVLAGVVMPLFFVIVLILEGEYHKQKH